MTLYIVCYAILIVALFTGLLLDKLRASAIIAFVPMFLLIVLRGMVGTDSAVYVQEFDVIRYRGVLASSFEPGFTLLVEMLTWIYPDSLHILIVLGGATAILMLCAGLLLERSPLLFMTLILPYFMIDMTMNGLRYGLAFSIVALGATALARGRLRIFIACAVLAASIQISSALLAVGLWMLVEARIKTFIGVAVAMAAAILLFGSYVEDKVEQNADLSGLGGLSGIAPLVATVVIVFALRYSDRKLPAGHLSAIAILMMQTAAFILARYYYAGLRFQSLFLFLLYLYVALMARRSALDLARGRLVLSSLLVAMAFSSASRLYNFRQDVNGFSPFNPYYFQRELNG